MQGSCEGALDARCRVAKTVIGIVITRLDPVIHLLRKAYYQDGWMPGSSPGMTDALHRSACALLQKKPSAQITGLNRAGKSRRLAQNSGRGASLTALRTVHHVWLQLEPEPQKRRQMC
jgi:hypothetical protein